MYVRVRTCTYVIRTYTYVISPFKGRSIYVFGVLSSARGRTWLKICERGDFDVVDISFGCMVGSKGGV